MAPDADDALLAQLRRGTLQFCVLALLADEPRYAFDVVRDLGAVGGMATSEGTIYPMLSRLRRDGLVATSWRESSSGPPRRYHELTPTGRTALMNFTDQWHTFSAAVDHLLARRANT